MAGTTLEHAWCRGKEPPLEESVHMMVAMM
uniref:Uncharacterized protein n=1 Tax=Arundo donax TaxID=35708 RepID=A0A0A9EKU5_ARUDO